jgi:UDP-N-acetyl-2-amino-2-deoxyglucuronate dehydrogenase
MGNMENSMIRVGLIGCGRIAGHHIRSIAAVDGVELAAVCDLETEKAEAYAIETGVPFYANYHEMLSTHDDIDTVAVITPSGMHFEHTMEMLEEFGRHVIIEKPTFMRPEQLLTAYAHADALGLDLFPVFQNRYNKAVRRVKMALDNGELGEIRTVSVRLRWCRPQRYYDMAPWRGTFSHDGGALTNQTIHHIDLLRHLGGEVEKVNATMRTMGADIEVEDTAAGSFLYTSGALGTLEATTAARPDDFEASLSFVCSKGLAQIGGIGVNELQIFTPDPDACATNSEDFKSIKGHGAVYGYGHTEMYQDILAARRGEAPYPVSKNDALETIRLLHAFYCSDESGAWTKVSDVDQSSRLGRPDDNISNNYRTPRT